jgi:hypothetical protein
VHDGEHHGEHGSAVSMTERKMGTSSVLGLSETCREVRGVGRGLARGTRARWPVCL